MSDTCGICSVTLGGLFVMYAHCRHALCFACYRKVYGNVYIKNCAVCKVLGWVQIICQGSDNQPEYSEFVRGFQQ